MPMTGLLHFSPALGLCRSQKCQVHYEYSVRKKVKLQTMKSSALASPSMQQQDLWNTHRLFSTRRPVCVLPYRCSAVKCRASLLPVQKIADSCIKGASETLSRSYGSLQGNPSAIKLISAVGVIVFALWGLGPLVRSSRKFFQNSNSSWRQSTSHYVLTSYLQPVFLWIGAMLVCRALDPIVMPSEASNLVKQRLLSFVRSLSTVLAFAYSLSSAIQQFQNFLVETSGQSNARNMGFQFAGKAVHTAVWVAAVSLFMELLGFSTQKWLTAGGLGTVMITLAGREIFTNFLSSVMIHATRPFIVNDWIQTKIEGYEVSGFVEHVGWWSPTVIRGEDREAVHIPNHKFTVNVVRNLTQKTHWCIKTHLAISHLDVNKINKIVADMRKVLAKNPQVEQQRLHRRVFLENVDPENQALLILISCFVKTSHHEEYLCVKEAILLDLLRVISHHGARLATPIRTIHRMYRDADLESAPESAFSRGSGAAINRSVLLIEPSYKISGEDRAKASPQSVQSSEIQDSLTTTRQASSDLKSNAKTREASTSTMAKETSNSAAKVEPGNLDKEEKTLDSKPKLEEKQTVKSSLTMRNVSVEERKVADSKTSISDEHSKLEPGLQVSQQTDKIENPACSSESSMESLNGSSSSRPQPKQDEKSSAAQPSKQRPRLEENIVLGVALEGSKRTLPIDEAHQGSHPTPAEKEEVVAKKNNGGGKGKEKENGNGTGIGKPGVEKDEKDN